MSGTLDVVEKRTVFVRNLSFDTNETSLREAFSKFGTIKYLKLCFDRELERPRGTAFIQFESSESAHQACAESDMFEMDDRRITIDMALPRAQAEDLNEAKKNATSNKEAKDNRNLALLKEGTIYANSNEARDISKADMLRRQKLEAANAEKLKLLHFFVSLTRLSVHNLPINCTDEELRNIFLEAIKPDQASQQATGKK